MWLLLENPIICKRDDNYMRNKRGDMHNERDPKHKICLVFQLLGASPLDHHRGSAPGSRWGTSVPRPSQLCPPPTSDSWRRHWD